MPILDDYSDLNGASQVTRNSWETEAATRREFLRYFSGEIFKERVPTDYPNEEEQPELYPVGLNLVKMLCLAQADSLFGEWEEDIIRFEPKQDGEVDTPEKEASEIARTILQASNANSMLWEVALDREIYGGGVIKISPSLSKPAYIRWSHIPLETFFPVWDPENQDELLEVYVVFEITREQAKERYKYVTSKETVTRVEHWTRSKYVNTIDGTRMDAYSGTNPWGFIPFVFIPRIRTTHWWGDSLTQDVMRAQDELNMRIADLGEAINYNTHPIKWGFNLPKKFSTENYPIGPNFLWDGGKVLGQAPEPHIEILEAKNPLPQGTFDYIKFIYDWSRTSVFAPPVAFGEDNGGGQRSGITLEIRLSPLIKATRRSRAYMAGGLSRAMSMSAQILRQKELPFPAKALDRLIDAKVIPTFAPLMPRDQAAIVDEIQKRLSTNPPTISLETAVKKQGDGTSEVERIKQMLADEDLWVRQQKEFENQLKLNEQKMIGNNSGSGQAPGGTNERAAA